MSSFKVLVVDDEPGIRMGTRRILQNFKVDYPFMDEHIEFEMLEAASGEEAIEIIDNQHPDIVLLDNKLPGIQGVQVLEYIRNKQYDIVVVMITSYASLELAVKATRDGAYDFIPKPFTPQELRSSMENITKQLFLRRMTQSLNTEGKHIRFQFMSVLSHELKAPLNAIEGYLHIIGEKQLGDKVDSYQEMIERSLERVKGMRQLILDMLDLTRIKSGKPMHKLQQINVADIARISKDTVRPFAIQRDVDVYVKCQEGMVMNIDPSELEIILNNLLSNAVKYNKEGGRVDCQISGEKDTITITVSDTGIGMSEEEQQQIFEDFVRIKNTKTRNITGSGLGLSIVKKMVDSYGGKITLQSIPDKGSTFTVILPREFSFDQIN
jgi:signal transduction histidine kinase